MIKVCGLRDSQNIRDIALLGVDWIGMIFWPRSKRYVSAPPAEIPDNVRRVGVFVDASIEEVKQHISDYRLDFVQLHGQESPAYVRALKPFPVIKAFNIATFPFRHERESRWRQWGEIRLDCPQLLSGADALPP